MGSQPTYIIPVLSVLVVMCLIATAEASCTLNTTLRVAASKHGRLIGMCLYTPIASTAAFKQNAATQWSIVTAENECKFDATEPSRNNFNFQGCDTIRSFAVENDMKFRGHTLVWHSQVASWVKGLSTEERKAAMVNHIQKVMAHYKGKVYAWDVVNEAVADSPVKLRDSTVSVWANISDYIDLAFQTARAADPNAKLFYNDYSIDNINTKSTFVYNMVKSMKARGIPIDGVGFQMHVSTQWFHTEATLTANFKRFADLNLEIHITEMDVKCPNGETDWSKQAEAYGAAMAACLKQSKCTSFQVWGITDAHSWLGTSATGLLFDTSYNPKPAACAIMNKLG